MAKPYVFDSHDIGILRQDATTKVGMMLARDKNDNPIYSSYIEEYLATQISTGGEAGYGSLPSNRELPIRQDDWRAGFGLETYDSSNSHRYYSSTGMDMRFKGMGIAGPTPTVQAAPVATHVPNIINAGMELETGWQYDATMTRSNTQAQAGTYSIKMVNNDGSHSSNQYLIGWTPGVQYTFACYIYGVDASDKGRIQISDGTQTISSAYVTTAGWTAKSVQITVAATATYLKLTLNSSLTNNNPVYFDTASITMDSVAGAVAYSGITRAHADFDDDHYYSLDDLLIKVDHTDGLSYLVWQYSANITALEPFTGNRLYVALGLSVAYESIPLSATFPSEGSTASTETPTGFQIFKTVHAATPVMWGNDSAYTIRSTTDPANGGANWSGQTVVSSSYYDITALLHQSGSLYIMKEDMPYYLSSAGAVLNSLAPELATETISTSNGKGTTVWQDKLYMPWGDQSLLESDAGTNTFINPADYCTNLDAFNGQVFAVAGDSRYLHAVLNNGTSVEVLVGRYEVIDGATTWVWHPIAEFTLAGCEACWVSSVYQKRLWISSTSSSNALYYIPLPIGYGNITTDTNRKFKTGVTMTTPWLHGEFKSTSKAFLSLELVMGHTYNAGRYFTVEYEKLGDSDWTAIGNYVGSTTSMTESKTIPVDASNIQPVSVLIRLKFTAVTNSTDYTPILLGYHIRGLLYPTQRQIISCSIICANEIQIKDGIDKGSFDTLRATIDEAIAATYPFTFYDIKGTSTSVKCLPVSPLYTVTKYEKGREQERRYNLLLQVMDGTNATVPIGYASEMFGVMDSWVIAYDAGAKEIAFANFLQSQGYDVWVCDGTADNVQIQLAINTLPAGGGKIQFSKGTFNCAAALIASKPISLIGQGDGFYALTGTKLVTVGATNLFTLSGTIAFTLKDMNLDGNSVGLVGLSMTGNDVVNSHFENLYVHHFVNWGSYDASNFGNTYTTCKFMYNGQSAVSKGGIYIKANCVTMYSPRIDGNGTGVWINDGYNTTLYNPVVEGNMYHGIYGEPFASGGGHPQHVSIFNGYSEGNNDANPANTSYDIYIGDSYWMLLGGKYVSSDVTRSIAGDGANAVMVDVYCEIGSPAGALPASAQAIGGSQYTQLNSARVSDILDSLPSAEDYWAGRVINVRTGAGQKTTTYIGVTNSANAAEWLQIGQST